MSIDDDVSAAVVAVAKAKVAEALGGDIIGKIVDQIMESKVNPHSRNSDTWFNSVVTGCVENVIRKSVSEHLETPQMKAQIDAAILNKSMAMATTIVDAFVTDSWQARLEIKIDR
jgi:hypothetical protein